MAKLIKLYKGNIVASTNGKVLKKISYLPQLKPSIISIDSTTLTIIDTEQLATSYDIIVDGELTTSINLNMVKTSDPFGPPNNTNMTVDGNNIIINYTNYQDTYFWIKVSPPLVNNKTYTIIFDCVGIEEGVIIKIAPDNKDSNTMVLTNGKNKKTFVAKDLTSSVQLLMDDKSGMSNIVGKEVVLSNFVIYENVDTHIFDLSTLELADGTHTISVISKSDGYDNTHSNSLTYEVVNS